MGDISIFGKCKLLVWKYLCYRRYYWGLTLVELAIPIIFVYVAARISEQFIGATTVQLHTRYGSKSVFELKKTIPYKFIYYFPGDLKTGKFVYDLSYAITDIDDVPLVKDIDVAVDEKELLQKVSSKNGEAVGLIFDPKSWEDDSKSLTYTIRDVNVWNTSENFVRAEADQNGPYIPDPYVSTGFAGLQMLVNEIFYKSRGSNKSFQDNEFTPFPYPEYTEASFFQKRLPLLTGQAIILTSLLITIPLIIVIIKEKKSGVREMMNMAGVEEWLIWASWFICTLFLAHIVYSLMTVVLTHDFRGPHYAVIRAIEGSFLWGLIMLYMSAQIAFAFMFCVVFDSVFIASISFCVTTLMFLFLSFKISEWQNEIITRLCSLVPAGAFMQAFENIAYYELLELPLTWRVALFEHYSGTTVPLEHLLYMFIVDTFLYLFLTYVISVFNPGKYRYKELSLPFLKKKMVEETKVEIFHSEKPKVEEVKQENPFIEKITGNDDKIILKLDKLEKKFGPIQAVKEVNLSIYEKEILVLVGHLYSGKSTVLSMASGLIESTSGSLLYRGYLNFIKNINGLRKLVGLCTQEDRLFPYFTIMDHLIFYGSLKGGHKEDIEDEAIEYLEMIALLENASDLCSVITSEMKRKLSIVISLMGNSEILVLDEPTTGLDEISRNRILNLLLKLKRNRSIILSTSVIKEATILGDHIAVMNNGAVACYGTPNFLKLAFGTGYEMLVTTQMLDVFPNAPNQPIKDPSTQIIEFITSAVAGTKVSRTSATEIVFNLPFHSTPKFPVLFKTLEGKKAAFRIDRFQVSCITLEKMFQKIATGFVYDSKGKLLKLDHIVEEAIESTSTAKKITGFELWLTQHKALFYKKYVFTYRNWFLFLCRVIIPTFLMTVLIWKTNSYEIVDSKVELSLASEYPNTLVMLRQNDFSNQQFYAHFHKYLMSQNIHTKFVTGTNLNDDLLNYARENIHSFRRGLILAIDINKNKEKTLNMLFYNKFARHSLPSAINMMDNAYLTYQYGEDWKITTYNHPINILNSSKISNEYNAGITENSPIMTIWYILLGFFTIDLLDFISSPVKAERIDGFKHLQFMSSVSPITYWTNTFVFDFILFVCIMTFRIIVFLGFDQYGFISLKLSFVMILIVLLLFIASGLLFMYWLSFILNSRFGSYPIIFFCNLICWFLSHHFHKIQTYVLGAKSFSRRNIILLLFKYPVLLTPPINFSLTFIKIVNIWRLNDKSYPRTSYLEFASAKNPNGILEEIIFFFIDILLYGGMLFDAEYSIFNHVFRKFIIGRRNNEESGSTVSAVLKERERVQKAIKTVGEAESTKNTDLLIAKGLRKVHKSLIGRSRVAVADSTFLVQAKECFAVLGPEGSGKTTTFKMITGEVMPTSGDSWILGVKLSENRTDCFLETGYCAQTDSVLEELTGNETLFLVASLRGVPIYERQDMVDKWVTILGLESVISNRTNRYNEEIRRKVCVAMALIGDPKVVLLDEPSSRFDTISKRSLYSVIGRIKSTGQAVVFSSQSMQECETLCDRFMIINKGEMKFIGSSSELKVKYGQGYSLTIVLKDMGQHETDESRLDDIQMVKYAVEGRFKPSTCTWLEVTKTTVQCEINGKLLWAEAFQRLEDIKNNIKFIKQYQLSEKSLDEVYTSLLKHNT